MEVLQPMLPTISTLLFYTDASVVANVCWALRCDSSSIQLHAFVGPFHSSESYICDGSHAHIQAVLESGALHFKCLMNFGSNLVES